MKKLANLPIAFLTFRDYHETFSDWNNSCSGKMCKKNVLEMCKSITNLTIFFEM